METLYILIPISLLFVAVLGVAVVWAISSGQYDDLETQAQDILLDDDDE